MSKQLKLSFILFAVFAGIVMAWKSFMNFFSGLSVITGSAGAGINFVAILTILVVLLLIVFTNKEVKKRIMDLFIVACVITFLEFFVYIALEFGIKNAETFENFMIYQNVITVIGLLYFAYIAFRFITEYKGLKLGFVEFILGNKKDNAQVKIKQAKELENGCLEEKPNNIHDYEDDEPETDEVESSEE